ncbi:FG-GAP repeat domain-containing protein [Acidicapsa ligni]|uniref:FG-GAP repeat domain-containing protein n=1 Tax=Acidicapsa ligni TaxID=542300 RepID=UPI0021DFE2E4|nr:VCBS repeat-containing protein [Acidicapsa ligni]
MFCIAGRPAGMASIRTSICAVISVAVLVFVTIVPAHAFAAGGMGDDDEDGIPTPTVAGDFNRDGIADMAMASMPVAGRTGVGSGQAFLTVLLGQKDGSFRQAASNPAIGLDPQSIVVGDFNGDGIPDLIVGDADGSLIELLGDGTGNLVSAGEIAHVSSVVSIARGDFNHDGIPDMAVSDSTSGSITILLGEKGGSFHTEWSFSYERLGMAEYLTAADFNGDGFTDLAVTNKDGEMIEVMLGNGHGTFTASPELRSVKDPYSHCAT